MSCGSEEQKQSQPRQRSPNRLRFRDYTRGASANQLDDGIGDILVLGLWNKVRIAVAICPTKLG
jgi:hypothetical protein